jgi:hypothetical protein
VKLVLVIPTHWKWRSWGPTLLYIRWGSPWRAISLLRRYVIGCSFWYLRWRGLWSWWCGVNAVTLTRPSSIPAYFTRNSCQPRCSRCIHHVRKVKMKWWVVDQHKAKCWKRVNNELLVRSAYLLDCLRHERSCRYQNTVRLEIKSMQVAHV